MTYKVTKNQTDKLSKVLPKKYHKALVATIALFNTFDKDLQEDENCHVMCKHHRDLSLFVSEGLIHLEAVDMKDDAFFFKMDSNTDIVIHEVAL